MGPVGVQQVHTQGLRVSWGRERGTGLEKYPMVTQSNHKDRGQSQAHFTDQGIPLEDRDRGINNTVSGLQRAHTDQYVNKTKSTKCIEREGRVGRVHYSALWWDQ